MISLRKKTPTTTNNKNFVRNFSYFYREKMFILTVFSSIGYTQKKTQSTYTLSVSRFKSQHKLMQFNNFKSTRDICMNIQIGYKMQRLDTVFPSFHLFALLIRMQQILQFVHKGIYSYRGATQKVKRQSLRHKVKSQKIKRSPRRGI